ncbi:hypothetical protein MMC14_009144 [Varicellaria rhodocarpa]|nr:hypothetical protein [Varicellaria rhodocarpa]
MCVPAAARILKTVSVVSQQHERLDLQEVMLSKDTRRKLAVHVTGTKEKPVQSEAASDDTTPNASTQQPAEASAHEAAPAESKLDGGIADSKAAGDAEQNGTDVPEVQGDERVELIDDIWAFKRAQLLYPSVK